MQNRETTVVVVEDDPAIADLVELYLRRDGYRVHVAGNGEQALEIIRARNPQIVVLDVGLPGALDGIDVCREIRRHSSVPIIMLTARDSEVDRVLGLEMGADDYVVKPFSARELVARVKAILRRTDNGADDDTGRRNSTPGGRGPGQQGAPAVLTVGARIEVDLARRETRLGGRPVALATREFDLLAHLAANVGLALTRQQLLDAVWGVDWVGDERTVDVHVRQLRRKLGEDLVLVTVWGIGYRLDHGPVPGEDR